MSKKLTAIVFGLAVLVTAAPARAGYDRVFQSGSLVIPMDLAYQDHGMFQAYGLVFQLLRHGFTVYWIIDPDKTWHEAACDTAGEECAWDCAEEGSGVKCPYPTASPDLYVSAEVVWDGEGVMNPGDPITMHGYRGGPFLVDAADRDAALPVIDAWNDQALWGANPWAERTVFQVVTVHETTADATGRVTKEMITAPTIAVFSDGNEDIATGYLRAAGIPQSNGNEFPAAKCGADNCGPGTDNPDMLTVVSIMGDMGTCDDPDYNHKNGALFTEDGLPAYCQIMSMHWNVADRNTVECDGGGCPATQAECTGQTFTYHGHEVVAEVRAFLGYSTHFFAECQAVNAYENLEPDPEWPFLDDPARNGHFLTTTGTPPDCPCTDGDFECVAGGCDSGTRDCCLPRDEKEIGAGFLIADRPDANTIQILHPGIAYNQLDGAFGTVGGSEPAYNLSTYLGTEYKNNMDVTFITGPDGPGDQDVWMTGFMDGECWIGDDDVMPGECTMGKVSYLGGHRYDTNLPLSGNPNSQGTRLFLNALFEADCVTTQGSPNIQLSVSGRSAIGTNQPPVEETYTVLYVNQGQGGALDAVLTVAAPVGTEIADFEPGGALDGNTVSWDIGNIGYHPAQPGDPPHSGTRWITLRFLDYGDYILTSLLDYRAGASNHQAGPHEYPILVASDRDGDGIPDEVDPFPDDPYACGDSDSDNCDDCSVAGYWDPANDGPDSDGDGICDQAGPDGGTGGAGSDKGCGCRSADTGSEATLLFVLLALLGLAFRRRR